MGKQIFNIKGMMRDLDPAKSPNQYAYEIRNLRLTAQEDSTMLALVSEKGNAQFQIVGEKEESFIIEGSIIGYCVLYNYLVLFTHDSNNLSAPDRIYRLLMNSMTMTAKLLYNGDLGFGEDGVDIEALGIYENEKLQKVYWIDSVHQPRFINIVANSDTMSSWNNGSFDFVPSISMNEIVEVGKAPYSGVFNAGTIQYILTYYNRNGQQTAAFYQSPMNYITYSNRGASPEDTVDNSFRIKIINPDANYDYVRVYSVFRSSENGTPICKRVADIRTTNVVTNTITVIKYTDVTLSGLVHVDSDLSVLGTTNTLEVIDNNYNVIDLENLLWYRNGSRSYYLLDQNYSVLIIPTGSGNIKRIQAGNNSKMQLEINNGAVEAHKIGSEQLNLWTNMQANRVSTEKGRPMIEYIDNGLSGEVVDYSEVLFAGGTNIIPSTMAQKSQTLFFGNYKTNSISDADKEIIRNHSLVHFGYSNHKVSKGSIGSFYMYDNQLDEDAKCITTFKGGEVYHFGIVLQDNNGTWTDVIPVGGQRNIYYPKEDTSDIEHFTPVKAYVSFDDVAKAIIDTYKAIKVVRLDTLPSVVYQGALAPTVFNHRREDNLPYCQSSWFFRQVESPKNLTPFMTQSKHNGNIVDGNSSSLESVGEIQGASSSEKGYYQQVISSLTDMDMFVDWNTITLHSPDIEFGQALNLNYDMRIVGILPITSGRTGMSCTWSTAPYSNNLGLLQYSPIIHNNLDTDGYEIDLNVFAYKDGDPNGGSGSYLYPIYPWHRNGSLTAQETPSGSDDWYALLDTKVMTSLREAAYTKYMSPLNYLITRIGIYQDDNAPILIEANSGDYHHNTSKVYMGGIDTILTYGGNYSGYGKSVGGTITALGTDLNEPIRMRYGSTKHSVFTLLSNLPNTINILPNVDSVGDLIVPGNNYENVQTIPILYKIIVGSGVTFNSSTGIIEGFQNTPTLERGNILMITGYSTLFYVTQILGQNKVKVNMLDGNWINEFNPVMYPNGDVIHHESSSGEWYNKTPYLIYFRYNGAIVEYYYTDAYFYEGESDEGHGYLESYTEWQINDYTLDGQIEEGVEQITQMSYPVDTPYQYVYIAELYTNDSLVSNYEDRPWYVASESKKTGGYCIEATIGDTYYQRYDCLKTYPISFDDQNQIIDIFSFMCETRINIDGRYDTRRGLADNTSTTNTNFNLLNKAYTQNDNFFTYHYINEDNIDVDKFPNQIIWTKTKIYGSNIDAWTHIVATSTLNMDGSLGEIRALRLWNDNLICFQDSGIAKIMYNERTTMSTTQGIPVEIANSGKVDGSQYISNNIGCKNKKSIQVTQGGIYFADSNTRELYRWSQGLESLSKSKGFNSYFYNRDVDFNKLKSFYDPKLKDVYFRVNMNNERWSKTECLVYNEQLEEFTSFFDYDMDFMFPYKDALVSVEHNSNNLWKQFESDEYLRYFEEVNDSDEPVYKEYSIELISAENPLDTKIFTNVEFRADVLNNAIVYNSQATESDSNLQNLASINKLPFKTMKVWNEYQNTGDIQFERLLRKGTNLSQKFRVWRADVERDRNDKLHKFTRISSPWARFRLKGGENNVKTVIHDIGVIYV